jgi:glycosyltransferase involved in cell wall biosynthesis
VTKRRRVLVLNHFAAPAGSPGGTRHVELFGRLERWDALILAANRNLLSRERQHANGIFHTVWVAHLPSSNIGRILSWASFAVTSFASGLRQRHLDVVYASSPHLLAGMTGWALSRIKHVPLVLEVRDLWPQVLVDMNQLRAGSALYRCLKSVERFLYRQADAVVVLAEGSVGDVVADGAKPARVVFIPNGADPGDFEVGEDREFLRKNYGMASMVVLYAGAHGPANGLELVLDAATDLAESHPDVSFWLVGDGVSKVALQTRALELRLHNVEFKDPVPKQEIPRLLAAADVGLHVLADVALFRRGVSPNKLFDYMAAGKPVLTNTPGEVTQLVEAAGAGIAVEPTGLAGGVRRMADASAEQRARWGSDGRRYLAEHRSRNTLARRLEELLDDVAAGGPLRAEWPAQQRP